MSLTYSESKNILCRLSGKEIDSFTVVENKLDLLEGKELDFIYSLCCYFRVCNFGKAFQLSAVESCSGYTIYLSEVTPSEYAGRFGGLSESMSAIDLLRGEKVIIESLSIFFDGEDVAGVEFRFSEKECIFLISGECYGVGGDFEISACDEMILVFRSIDSVRENIRDFDAHLERRDF